MFELQEKLTRLDIPASKVLRLKRSMGEVQTALPGQKSQVATAYVCAFTAGKGVRVICALHLHADYKLIYYLNSGGEVSSDRAGELLNQGLAFAESLGFMMSDLDIHKMEGQNKVDFWESLPLKKPPVKPEPKPEPVPEPAPVARRPSVKAVGTSRGAVELDEDDIIDEAEELSSAESVELDLGLPRRKLVSRTKRQKPSPAELARKKDELRENLGRFLSSL